jgi:hypothetical protein
MGKVCEFFCSLFATKDEKAIRRVPISVKAATQYKAEDGTSKPVVEQSNQFAMNISQQVTTVQELTMGIKDEFNDRPVIKDIEQPSSSMGKRTMNLEEVCHQGQSALEGLTRSVEMLGELCNIVNGHSTRATAAREDVFEAKILILKKVGILKASQKELLEALQRGLLHALQHDLLRNLTPWLYEAILGNEGLSLELRKRVSAGCRNPQQEIEQEIIDDLKKDLFETLQRELLKVLQTELLDAFKNKVFVTFQKKLLDTLQNNPIPKILSELRIILEDEIGKLLEKDIMSGGNQILYQFRSKVMEVLQTKRISQTLQDELYGKLKGVLPAMLLYGSSLRNILDVELREKLHEIFQKKLPSALRDRIAQLDSLLTTMRAIENNWAKVLGNTTAAINLIGVEKEGDKEKEGKEKAGSCLIAPILEQMVRELTSLNLLDQAIKKDKNPDSLVVINAKYILKFNMQNTSSTLLNFEHICFSPLLLVIDELVQHITRVGEHLNDATQKGDVLQV